MELKNTTDQSEKKAWCGQPAGWSDSPPSPNDAKWKVPKQREKEILEFGQRYRQFNFSGNCHTALIHKRWTMHKRWWPATQKTDRQSIWVEVQPSGFVSTASRIVRPQRARFFQVVTEYPIKETRSTFFRHEQIRNVELWVMNDELWMQSEMVLNPG